MTNETVWGMTDLMVTPEAIDEVLESSENEDEPDERS